MVWLMRCGSDTESARLLLMSTEAEGRVGGGGGGGCRIEGIIREKD